MASAFIYDVFLSHSAKDKAVVRAVAERLKDDGLEVWFDEWAIKPGDDIPHKIEEGLEHSRGLVLCMSANAFGSDWAHLESGTFRFRDPLNKERRFIPLRLDDAPIKGSLAQFLSINWLPDEREEEYARLLEACRPVRKELTPEHQAARERLAEKIHSLGHAGSVRSVAFSPDGTLALSGSDDNTVRLWEVDSGRCLRVLEGHAAGVNSVAWSSDGGRALSGSSDNTVRLWDVDSGRCLRVLEGHADRVWSVAWSSDGGRALSGSDDRTVRLWDVDSGRCLRVLEGHAAGVNSVAWSSDGGRALSGSNDNTVRLWDVDSGRCLRVLEGHADRVNSVAWSSDGGRALSGSDDNTVRLWDVDSGRCLRVLEGHADSVWSVEWSSDGGRALSGSSDNTVRLWDVDSGRCLRVLEGHASVRSVAWSSDGGRALSGSFDKTVRLWDVDSGRCLRVLKGHDDIVRSVAWSSDGGRALSGSDDKTVRLWDVDSGRCLRVLEGHARSVWSVAWSSDGGRALSGSFDNTVRLWDVDSGRCLRVLEGHAAGVLSVAWSSDGGRALSGSSDNTVRLWDVGSGRCLRVLEGHADSVRSVAWSSDGGRALSGSFDKTVRLWDVDSGRCLRVLEGHARSVSSVAWSSDGGRALSGSEDETVRLWDLDSGRCLRVLEGHASVRSVAWSSDGGRALSAASNGVWREWDVSEFIAGARAAEITTPALPLAPDQVQYTNAKVLLVGESGAGKTGLSKRLAFNEWEPSDSTVGAWATQWKLPVSSAEDGGDGVEREIWLWDFGGQADQRLIHQLYMDETALAVLVFDGQKQDLFETLGQWDRDLTRASRKEFAKLLVAGRVDASGLRVSRSQVETFWKERGFTGFLETSAKIGTGCDELKQAILTGIPWENIPWRSSPLLFKRLKEEIVGLKDAGRVLMRFNELRQALQLNLLEEKGGELTRFKDEELQAVVSLLAGPGVVWELKFGSFVLLQPERINAYAQAVIQTMREDEYERGCLLEERVLNGDLTYHSSIERLGADEERFVLLAMHQTLVERGLCLREPGEKGTLLVFPSYYRRERPELVGHPAVLVSYRFNGFLDDIYATLVVRLHHTGSFKGDELWRYAADFKTLNGKQLGVKLTRRGEGAGELEVYFDPAIGVGETIIFSRFVHEHLLQSSRDVVRLRYYVCPHCGTPVGNREVAMKRLGDWLEQRPVDSGLPGRLKSRIGKTGAPNIICANCEKRVPLWDDLEEHFASPETKQRVRELQERSAIVLDNESKERALVGEVISTVALAGQLSREFNVSDHGIDMEIEFKSDDGEATGRKLYLQLKSGDSYLRERKRDGAEVFAIKDERHGRYWMTQAFPVLLVIRSSEGETRWMEVRDWLKRESNDGTKAVKRIVFEGERLDVMSVRRWRDRVLGQE